MTHRNRGFIAAVQIVAAGVCLAACACTSPTASLLGPETAGTPAAEPSCACSYPPTPPPGAISEGAAIAAALRVTPGSGARTRVVWAQVNPDPFAPLGMPSGGMPSGGTPLPESSRLVWMIRLEGGLTPSACPGDTLPTTAAGASQGPCLDTGGGVVVVLDPMTGALLGWTH
jgi:hypothetical protein